ncbi:pentapeptide repeat-containing protein [Dokdonia sp.]|uniref:pentapeptide repeat-containing protein n=1 Tax=Dokdonia sp. TaxID=2024995 RepID=UPI0032656713
MLKGIANIIKDSVTPGAQSSLPADIIDTITSIKLEDKPEQIGWKLVSRSIAQALFSLIFESSHLFPEGHIETKPLDERLNKYLENKEYYLENDFFKNPKSFKLIEDIKPTLKEYLELLHFDDIQATNILIRLNSYFVFALISEWRINIAYYAPLESIIKTPFNEAEKKETEWKVYEAYLQNEIHKPIFSETFSLNQVYIPLRAYYKEKTTKNVKEKSALDHLAEKESNTIKRIVVDLESHLIDWVNKGSKNDSIRIIRGGPGYGKSSFLKVLASKLSSLGNRVLFIPLHRFDIEDKLDESIRAFLRYDKYFTHDPINDDDEKLVILFDGLDELAMQGKVLADIAQSFLREVEKSITNFNSRELKIQAIISGRDIIIQQNESDFRNNGQILRLLPYYLPKNEKTNLTDLKKLLDKDQRDLWWKKYGQVTGLRYKKLPEELQNEEIDEITAQPLLNFLVALSYQRGKITFTENTNLNEIYDDLLKAVYERSYADGKRLQSIKKIEIKHFCVILEEIALSAWHGKGRTTTVKDITQHFETNGLTRLLKQFISDAEKGVLSLLAAFYFRQAGQSSEGSQTFEFTHKSFGEYLTAKKLTNKLLIIQEQLKENENDPYKNKGWNEEDCLVEWIKLFGPMIPDYDLIKFIRNEFQLLHKTNPEILTSLQSTIVILFNQMLDKGMPLEKISPRLPTYNVENKQAINAERALLVFNSIIANITDIVSDIKWPNETSFGNFTARISEQRVGGEKLMLNFYNHLNIKDSTLHVKDLYNVNFYKTNLNGVQLAYVNLTYANLREGDLKNTHLPKAILRDAILRDADLTKANLRDADLTRASLRGANLTGADLTEAILRDADLRGADLRDADLRDADLTGVILTGANLKGADLTNTKISKKVLEELKKNKQI